MQAKFCQQQEALLHGDLHTGSFMCTPTTTWAIDAEFAFYGPIAFDVCKMVANLLLAFFASDGYASHSQPRTEQRQWLLQVLPSTWHNAHVVYQHTNIDCLDLQSDTAHSQQSGQWTTCLQAIQDIWRLFQQGFSRLWDSAAAQGRGGDLYPAPLFPPGPALQVSCHQLCTHCTCWAACHNLQIRVQVNLRCLTADA